MIALFAYYRHGDYDERRVSVDSVSTVHTSLPGVGSKMSPVNDVDTVFEYGFITNNITVNVFI